MLCKLAFHFGNFWNSKCSLQNLSNRKLNFKYFLYALEFKNSKASPFLRKDIRKSKAPKSCKLQYSAPFVLIVRDPLRETVYLECIFTQIAHLYTNSKKRCIQCNFKRFPTSLRC